MKKREWNPRYLEYCRLTSGLDPDKQMARDRERWPGGVMTGFILWINDKLAQYKMAKDLPRHEPIYDQPAFDAWLATLESPAVKRAKALVPVEGQPTRKVTFEEWCELVGTTTGEMAEAQERHEKEERSF